MVTPFRNSKITTRLVEALKPGEMVGDTELPGYFVRRQKTGVFILSENTREVGATTRQSASTAKRAGLKERHAMRLFKSLLR